MSASARFHQWVVGPGLLQLQPKAPLLVQRWLWVRGLAFAQGGAGLARIDSSPSGRQDSPLDLGDLKAVMRDGESADWQDDVSAVLMALLLLCGLVAAYTPLSPALHGVAPFTRPDYEVRLSDWVGSFAAVQAMLLALTAVAWRLLASAPTFLYVAALVVFGCWSLTVFMVAPQLHFFVLMPMMLVTLVWVLKQEITRALRAPGASVFGALAVLGIFLLAIYLIGTGGYLYGMLSALGEALDYLRGLSRRSSEGAFVLVAIVSILATSIWSKKLILAWSANDRNPPVICACAASWTFLMDVATFGVFGLYSPPTTEKGFDPYDAKPADAPEKFPSESSPSAPEEPTWSIGELVKEDGDGKPGQRANPGKRP